MDEKCKCGKSRTPGYGDYCKGCYFEAFGEFLDEHPDGGLLPAGCELIDDLDGLDGNEITHHPDPNLWSEKYAIVLEMADMPVLGNFIANFKKPYRIPVGKENLAHNLLHKKGNMVIVADKKTLLDNPFDLCEWDFNNAQDLPTEAT